MEDTNRVYRIRTVVGAEAPNVIHVPLNQSYDMFEILSLKLDQANTYKTYESDYGVIVGRVTANGGFGVPNAKVSIFIEVSDEETLKNRFLYNYYSTSNTNDDGVRYNVLPDFVDDVCHQDVGTFPNKRLVLDNKDEIEIFDKYWKYTTTTNHAGDYMLFGIPTGSQQLHVDVDLSDCGILSQRPRDMIGKGYNANMFESPNKFKYSTNLNSLAQIISQDRGVYVYPYWGDVSDGNDKFSITRCDINLEYKFESYAVFIGSIVTDKGSNAIGKNCTGTEQNGKMSDLIAGEGTIEMIRKTLDNRVEEFPIMGNRLIDGDGVWCYQIPMNLDYVMTDEFGNLVPTDNPDKGIATRTRVRFRISLDENPNDATARKRARYLVPNNPRMGEGDFDETLDADYEFGSSTRDESYCDMFWNKVYTVKNYIPKLQKNSKETNRKHTGIKLVNHYGDNNPMPYNALTIKLSFTYRIICVLTKVVINLIEFLNELISIIGAILCLIIKIIELPGTLFRKIFSFWPVKKVGKLLQKGWNSLFKPVTDMIYKIMPSCIGLSSEFCDDGINQVTYYPGCGYFLFSLFKMSKLGLDCVWEQTEKNHTKNQLKICENEHKTNEECEMSLTTPSNKTAMLYNCVENQLAQQNDATSFNFYNDWINGVLYAPLWYRKITPKKRFFFGFFKRKAKDDWCSSQREYPGMRILHQCTTSRDVDTKVGDNGEYLNFDGDKVEYRRVVDYRCDSKCHKKYVEVKGMNGVILSKETMLGQTVYYYKAVEYDSSLPHNPLYKGSKKGDIKLMFATDIVLLGSLNECDTVGVPQFFKSIESTTYNLPTDILFTDYDFILEVKEDGETGRQELQVTDLVKTSEMAGCDWGNPNEFDKYDGGLFYSIGCSSGSIKLDTKSCINLTRICEYGVSLDETKEVADLKEINDDLPEDMQLEVDTKYFQRLITDGFVSWDELYNLDERSMFATMNGNNLKTKLNITNGLYEYDFRYLYPENFDGSLKDIMKKRTEKYKSEINYKNNYKLEEASRDYYIFRMGNKPYYYDMEKTDGYAFPRYENSFYFYFGLKAGKTAIEKFNSKYFSECWNANSIETQIGIKSVANSWCSRVIISTEDKENGYSLGNDGYLAIDFSNISTPYNLLINGVTNGKYSVSIDEITEEKIQFVNDSSQVLNGYVQLKGVVTNQNDNIWEYNADGTVIPMMNNGSYQGVVTDNDGNINEFLFTINGVYLTFKMNAQRFEQPNNVLIERFHTYNAIAQYHNNVDTTDITNIQRTDIGGVVTVYDIFMGGEELNYYSVEIRAKEGTPLDLSGEYSGASLTCKNNIVTVNSGGNSILYKQNHHYAFGIPKGGCEYTITITQLCEGGVDSDNIVSTDIFVGEPMPYKMYINDVDYELVKYFNHYTGWTTNSYVSSHNVSVDRTLVNTTDYTLINVTTFPWFYTENIYYNQDLLGLGSNSGYTNNDIVSFYVEKDNNNTTFEIKAVTEDGAEHNILLQTLIDEFTKNKYGQTGVTVYYNWVDDYIVSGYEYVNWNDANEAFETIDDFIDDVNTVLNNRRDLVELVNETFFISCQEPKSIYITSQTDKLPYTQTIVYHPEKAVEYEDYNILDGDSLVDKDIDNISDIRIPTISYESSTEFGTGNENSDKPCLVAVDKKYKKPYYVGIMNFAEVSIPTDSHNNSFTAETRDNAKYIKHSSTLLNDLFSFPLIDKILKADYIAWSSFINIPKYGFKNSEPLIDIVTMNGLLAGVVCNGNAVNNKFYQQTLNDIELSLSDNITDKTQTYIEKRVINGFNYNNLGEWVLSFLRSAVSSNLSQELIDAMNAILPITITVDNIEDVVNSLTIENDNIKYGSITISISGLLEDILSFTNYVTSTQVSGQLQYAFVLPTDTFLILQDESGCGTQEMIDGGLTIRLAEASVNDCRDGKKVFELESDNDLYYSVFKTDTDGVGYPLNDAESNGLLWQITRRVNGIYNSNSAPQNLFSYQMKTKYLRGEDSLIDKNFKSHVLISGDSEEEEYETTYGYGTTGAFQFMTNLSQDITFDYPVFVVGEAENHVRTLTPVYDYSYVGGYIKFGILERKDVDVTIDENTGEATYTVQEPIKDYKFGIAVKPENFQDGYKGHFYLENYKYKLSGKSKIDDYNTIEISQETMLATGQFLFQTISESLYKTIKARLKSVIVVLKEFVKNTTITAIDYTGLKHICGISINDLQHAETTWYTYIWYANMPKDENNEEYPANQENGGIKYKGEYYNHLEFVYEKDKEIEVMNCEEGRVLGIAFLGWSENKPDRNNIIPIGSIPTTATEPKIYFANWDVATPKITVQFKNYDGTVLDTQMVEEGENVSPRQDLAEYLWYLSTDTTKTPINFGTSGYGPITQPTTFIRLREFIVNWIDGDASDLPKVSVTFNVRENGGSWQDNNTNLDYMVEANKNSEITCDRTPIKSNCDFLGWSPNKNSTTALPIVRVGENNLIVYAIFVERETPPIIPEYFDPITENTEGATSLKLRQYGISTSGNFRLAADFDASANLSHLWYFSSAGSTYAEFEKNNTGGINVTGLLQYYSLVDDYGIIFKRTSGYGTWQGGTMGANSFGAQIYVSPVNDSSISRYTQLTSDTDENNVILLRGQIVNKAIRIPYSGYSGTLQTDQYPYTFDSAMYYIDPSVTYITKTNSTTLQGTAFTNNSSINVNGFNAQFSGVNDTCIDYKLTYNIARNDTGDYKYHIVFFGPSLDVMSNFYGRNVSSTRSVMVQFIQEYNVKNRVYYGKGFNGSFDDKYNETPLAIYKYNAWFESCSSKILMGNDDILINHFNIDYVAYPNSEDFEYTFGLMNEGDVEVLDNNYMWGNKSFTIVSVPSNNKPIFRKK